MSEELNEMMALPKNTELASQDLAQHNIDATKPDFIPTIRIVQPAKADADNPAGSWNFMDQRNLGSEVEAVIMPWRFHAIRFKNNDVDAEDFNMWPDSQYDRETNNWIHPQGYTPGYEAIMNKEIPDDYQGGISNCDGFDLCFFVPEVQSLVTFLLAKTAKTMTDSFEICKNYRGRKCVLRTEKKSNKRGNTWYVPKITLVEGDAPQPGNPDLIMKQLNMFLNPGKVYNPDGGVDR